MDAARYKAGQARGHDHTVPSELKGLVNVAEQQVVLDPGHTLPLRFVTFLFRRKLMTQRLPALLACLSPTAVLRCLVVLVVISFFALLPLAAPAIVVVVVVVVVVIVVVVLILLKIELCQSVRTRPSALTYEKVPASADGPADPAPRALITTQPKVIVIDLVGRDCLEPLRAPPRLSPRSSRRAYITLSSPPIAADSRADAEHGDEHTCSREIRGPMSPRRGLRWSQERGFGSDTFGMRATED